MAGSNGPQTAGSKSRIGIDPIAGGGSERRRMPRGGLPPHLEAMMFGPSRVPHPERSKDGKGPIRSWAFRTGPGHTGEPMPVPDPISAGRRSFTRVKTRRPGPDTVRAETMHPGCPFLPEPRNQTIPKPAEPKKPDPTKPGQRKTQKDRPSRKNQKKQAPTPQPSQKNQKTRKRPRNQQTRKPNITKRQPCASCTHPVGGRRERRHS